MRCRPANASSDTSSRASRSRDWTAHANTPSTSAAYFRVKRAQLGLPGELCLQLTGIGGQIRQKTPDLARHLAHNGQCVTQLCTKALEDVIVGSLQSSQRLPDRGGRRTTVEVHRFLGVARQRGAGAPGRLTQCVQLRQTPYLGDECFVLPRLGIHGVDLGERELEPVGLLGKLTAVIGAVVEVSLRFPPPCSKRPVALDATGGAREPINCGTLLVGANQSELVVLTVQGEQVCREGGQGFGRHAASGKVGARRTLATDGPQRDHAAVLIAVASRRFQHLVDRADAGRGELSGGEPALYDGAVGSRADAVRIRSRPTQQM